MKHEHRWINAILSFMKWKQIFFVKEAVTFILREQDILVKEALSFIMKKHDNFLKEVVSFLKKLLVSRKYQKNADSLPTLVCFIVFILLMIIMSPVHWTSILSPTWYPRASSHWSWSWILGICCLPFKPSGASYIMRLRFDLHVVSSYRT